MSTALVFGANGISGIAMLEQLFKTPHSEYKKIIAVSRREPVLDHQDPRLVFKSVDLLQPIETVTAALQEAGAEGTTDAFFFAYVEKADPQELNKVNNQLLSTALEAVQAVCEQLKTFVLQTGYKWYGAHLGGDHLAPYPWKEDDPPHKGENFYVDQEAKVQVVAETNAWGWIVTRPVFIIGQTRGSAMPTVTTIALYATALKAQGKPLIFPGASQFFEMGNDNSTASNNAAFQLWATKNDKTWNQVFNIHDGRRITWSELWPKIADFFDMPLANPPADPPPSDYKEGYDIVNLHSAAEWAKSSDFEAIAKEANIDKESFQYASWGFLDFITSTTWGHYGSLDKARALGWDVEIDSWRDGWLPVLNQLKADGIIPQ